MYLSIVHPLVEAIILNIYTDLGDGILDPYCQVSSSKILFVPSKEECNNRINNIYPSLFRRLSSLIRFQNEPENDKINRAMKWMNCQQSNKSILFGNMSLAYEECIHYLMTIFMQAIFPADKYEFYLDIFALTIVHSQMHNTILKQSYSIDKDAKREIFFVYECFSISYLLSTCIFQLLHLPYTSENINVRNG